MADAPDSKSGRGNPVRVQVPPPAPKNPRESLNKNEWKRFLIPFPFALLRGRSSFADRKSHPLQARQEVARTKHKNRHHLALQPH
jgi:hypothetical protein